MSFENIKKISQLNNYNFIHINTTLSTMNDAKNYIEKKNTNCIILSDEQTKGKGRRGNIWHSPKGNIYFSIAFKNFLEIRKYFLFSLIIAISVKSTLKKFNAKNIFFKWPNDIYFENKKFCGIILESCKTKKFEDFIICGIGINFASSPDIKENLTTHIKTFCDIKKIPDFLIVFLEKFFYNLNYLKLKENDYLINQYKESLMFLGEKIILRLDDNSIVDGKFLGINTDGSLILKSDDKIKNIYNGSIIL